jgi:septum formation protein
MRIEEEIKKLLGNRKLVLASGSPRRAEILKKAELQFEIKVPRIEEENSIGNPEEQVLKLSEEKAEAVAQKIENSIILGADTIVVLENEILGKPKDQNQAFQILKKLSGKTHAVYTGVCLINQINQKKLSDFDKTIVKFNRLSDEDIWDYISTGEPMDKAGAYGIQGMGNFLVEYIVGDLNNVIGLPLLKLKQLLSQVVN